MRVREREREREGEYRKTARERGKGIAAKIYTNDCVIDSVIEQRRTRDRESRR